MEKIKKTLIFLLVQLFMAFLLLSILEVVSYFIIFHKYEKDIANHYRITGKRLELKYSPIRYLIEDEYKRQFRPVEYRKSQKPPILLFGGSFTQGTFISESETFSRKLADYTKRTVYNRGICSTGPSFILQQLRWKDFKKDIPETDYIVYTFIEHHVRRGIKRRLCPFDQAYFVKYKKVNGNLIEDKPLFLPLHSLFSAIVIDETIENSKIISKKDELLFELLMKEIKSSANKLYPSAKFVVLVYQDRNYHYKYNHLLKKLETLGYRVVYTDDLIGDKHELRKEKYYSADEFHPSGAAWDIIVPKLTSLLNL